jgi:mono/diheme cytochrome c family protein
MHKAWSLPLVLVLTVALTGCPGGDDRPPAPAQQPPGGGPPAAAPALDPAVQLPPGVTAEMISQGQQLYGTVCVACHGPGGTGSPLGPALNDQNWIHITGEYEEIVNITSTGVPQPREYPAMMPPMGGGNFNQDQLRAISAYVYAISHGS